MKKIKHKFKHFIKIILGKDFFVKTQIKVPIKWYGNRNAGFYVIPTSLNSKSVIYSFGIGEDISFDEELIKEFNCSVYGFDPTPKSIQYILNKKISNNFHFYPYGIYSYNGNIKFYLPRNPQHVSCTTLNTSKTLDFEDNSIEVPVKKISSIIEELRHKKIDILKMDIEGSEYQVLNDILNSQIEIEQILIEFHHRFSSISINDTKNAIKALNVNGYKIAAISDKYEEFTFIKTKK